MASNEVLCVVQRLEVPLEYFTDPLRVDGEARFSWCHQGGHGAALSAFEQKAGSWVGAYRLWRRRCGQPGSTLRPSLALTRSSRPEDAAEAGERLIAEWSLEPASATELTRAIQERLKALVLMVDAPVGVSFGTCQLNDLDAILIDRNASVGRRNANLAHALFRVLTSGSMQCSPYASFAYLGHASSGSQRGTGTRSVGSGPQRLAVAFGRALMVPAQALASLESLDRLDDTNLVAKLNEAAEELGVETTALCSRLVATGQLSGARSTQIESDLSRIERERARAEPPPLLSRPFAKVMATALEQGHVSVRRAAALVGGTIEDLRDLFQLHDVDYQIGL